MKGNKKILVIAVLLLLIAASYTTYAIYKTSVTTNATVSAAAWNVSFKNGEDTITSTTNIVFGTSDCTDSHVAPGKIAPSYSCSKQITLNATGTEVDVQYSVTPGTPLDNGSTYPTNANQFTATITDGGTGTIAWNAQSHTATLTVELTWAGAESDTDSTLVAKQVVASP